MSSWWRKIAELQGSTQGTGSWKRLAALGVGTIGSGSSWPRLVAQSLGTQQGVGSWTRRLTPTGGALASSWARALYESGGLFSPFSLTLFDAMEVEPDDDRKAVIDTFIKALVAAGVWDLLDVLYVFAAHTEQAALLNWKSPGTFDATLVSGVVFTTDRGFTGGGAADYIDSNYNPSTAGGNWTQPSASMGFRSLTNNVNNQFMIGQLATNASIIIRFGATVFWNINGAGMQVSAADTGMDKSFVVSRITNGVIAYRDGASVGTASGVPDPVANAKLAFLTTDGQFSNNQIASGFAGGGLSSGRVAAYDASELAYMQAVGAVP